MDITPKYAATLFGMSNALASIGGVAITALAGYIITGNVSKLSQIR